MHIPHTIDDLLDAAIAAQANAYAPYSGFQVGACLRGGSGVLYSGCNVENSAYPNSQCAEAGALSALVLAGERHISEILVVGTDDTLCSPCGSCRQRLSELATADTPVHICGPRGVLMSTTLGKLLPYAFDGAAVKP